MNNALLFTIHNVAALRRGVETPVLDRNRQPIICGTRKSAEQEIAKLAKMYRVSTSEYTVRELSA